MTQNPLNLQHETYLNSPDWEQLNEDLVIGFTTKNGESQAVTFSL